eukprot:gene17671-17878_t
MSLGLLLAIVLLLALFGGFSGRVGGYGYGYGHNGVGLIGVVLIVDFSAMTLVNVIVVLIVVGVVLGLINRWIPMESNIKSILNGVVVIAVVLWLFRVFDVISLLSAIHVGK